MALHGGVGVNLSELTRIVLDLDRPTPAEVVAITEAVVAFAAAHPEWPAEEQGRMRLKVARSLDPAVTADGIDRVLGLAQVGATLAEHTATADDARADAYDVIRAAVAAGMSESAVTRASGVSRMTVRKVLGK